MTENKLNISEVPSPHFDQRPAGVEIDTIVIHSMYNDADGEDFDIEACCAQLEYFNVSAHYLIGVCGECVRCVAEEARAWHAGVSSMPFEDDARDNLNHFSIGIELIGNQELDFTDAQYDSLSILVGDIIQRHPISNIVGHSDAAPERKTDPWGFDWARLRRMLEELGLEVDKIRFSA